MKKMPIIAFTLVFTVTFALPAIASDFKIVKKQGAITLYERWISGAGKETVRELKAEFMVESSVDQVISLLKSQAAGTQWNANASMYKITYAVNSRHWINYIRYNMPALFDDQECCLLYKIQAPFSNTSLCIIDFESTQCTAFPVSSGVKRITGVRGQWKLQPQNNQLLQITYLISSDRNTRIPRFISDPIVHKNLFNTMERFKTILENRSLTGV